MTVDDAKIHLTLPLSLEKACNLLRMLDWKNNKGFYVRQVQGVLKVDFISRDEHTVQFRIWVARNFPDLEMIGVLTRINETKTTLDGESKRGFLYTIPILLPIIVGLGLTLGMKSSGPLLFVFGGIVMGVYMARSYSPSRFSREIERRILKNIKKFL